MSAAAPGAWALEPFGLQAWPTARKLLLRCYPCTPPALWDAGIERLRRVPSSRAGEPIGMLLQGQQGPLGLALLLASWRPVAGAPARRHVNGSSWAIVPSARERALWMARHGMADMQTVYTALTPIPSTLRILQRIGFAAATHQCVLAATPRLAWQAAASRARQPEVRAGRDALHALRDDPLAPALHDHVQLGCEVLALQSERGVQGWAPLVFRPQQRLGWLRTAELLYAPSQAQLAQQAPALAAPLLRRGYAMLALDMHQDLAPSFPSTRLFQRRFVRGPAAADASAGVDHLYSELVYLHR